MTRRSRAIVFVVVVAGLGAMFGTPGALRAPAPAPSISLQDCDALPDARCGTLDVFGTVDNGVLLSLGTSTNSDLKLEGVATSASAITINNANQTLEVGATGALTINQAETVSLGKISMSGGTIWRR